MLQDTLMTIYTVILYTGIPQCETLSSPPEPNCEMIFLLHVERRHCCACVISPIGDEDS